MTILFSRSRPGQFVQAARDDETAAASLGINAMRHRLLTVALSCGLTAVAGAYYTQYYLFVGPEQAFGSAVSIEAIVPAVIGGIGTIWGPVIGAAIIGPLSDVVASTLRNPPPFLDFLQGTAGLDVALYAVILIAIVLFLPKGVFGVDPRPVVAPMSLLQVESLSKAFAGLHAVENVSVEVEEHEFLGIIGPNGAGKTTLFSLLAGEQPPTSGRVVFDGQDITGWSAYKVADAGLVRTFQLMRPFGSMTVLENVTIAALQRHRSRTAARRHALEVLDRVQLGDSYAVGLRVALDGRAQATRARPRAGSRTPRGAARRSAGRSRASRARPMIDLLRQLHGDGLTVVFVEHIMAAVMALSERLVVMHEGQVLAEGPPREVVEDPGHRGLPRRGAGLMLDVKDLHAGYGRMEILHGLDLHVDAQEIVSLDRRQRRRQDHDAAGARPGSSPEPGHGRARGQAAPDDAPRPDRAGQAWCTWRRTESCSVRLQVSENLEMGAYTQPRSSQAGVAGPRLRAVPDPGRASYAEGR